MPSENEKTNQAAKEQVPIAKKLSGRGKSRSSRAKKISNAEGTSGDQDPHDTKETQLKMNVPDADISREEALPKPRKEKLWLTPAQLEALKSGPKANIFVGPADDQFIGLEGAYSNLLCHFSNLAKMKLSAHGANRLYIPNCDKKVVVWIYRYMLAGEKDPEGDKRFEDLDLSHLVHLYNHASTLEYEGLMSKITLRARFLIREDPILDKQAILQVASVLHLRPILANAIAQKAVEVGETDWTAYFACIENNENLENLMGSAIEKELKRLVSKSTWFYNRYKYLADVQFSTGYYRHPYGSPQAAERGRLRMRSVNYPTATSTQHEDRTQPEPNPQKKPRLLKRKAMPIPRVSEPPAEKSPASKPRVKIPAAADSKEVSESKTAIENAKPDQLPQRKPRKSRTKRSTQPITTTESPDLDPPMQANPNEAADAPHTTDPKQSRPRPRSSKATITCYNCQELGHLGRECLSKILRPPPICYNCNETGHIARNCTAPRNQNYTNNNTTSPDTQDQHSHYSGPPPTMTPSRSSGPSGVSSMHVLTDISNSHTQTSSYRYPYTGQGRNKHYRRAKLERMREVVEPVGNGEGITTYEVEARRGQVTRLGLVV
ncbi:hypothetical protein K491DRAFT_719330 [Lophiostoma macrostomum CBS 122681]|uniref:CCHC-type domain-containing protein n=1 Tax=Lophiostoma macrostomum CBS 122681 TaxID=1314788 RepID=A0A6A6SY58_9PLEO|nr:hypothetical protein K491DRAFT_719330 [Lophiostoma macrostomum CBS 122681]